MPCHTPPSRHTPLRRAGREAGAGRSVRSRRADRAALALTLACALAACSDTSLAPRADGVLRCSSRAVRLEVGQAVEPLHAGQTQCEIAAIAGAEYVVAWLDPRAIAGARVGPEPSYEPYPLRVSMAPEFDPFGTDDAVRAPQPVAAPSLESGARVLEHAPLALRHDARAADDGVSAARPRFRTTPWVLGETFLLEDDVTGLPRPAEVLRVYDGYAVVARWTDETANDDEFIAQLDTAYAIVAATMPAVWSALFVAPPLRSSAAGQYLFVLQRETIAQLRALDEAGGDTIYSWMELYPFPAGSALRLAGLLAHEMTHHQQRRYMHATRAAAALPSTTGASYWAVEGGANLMSYELVRRLAGVGFATNHPWRSAPTTPAMSIYQQRAQPANGTLTDGFESAMGFLRDLTLRRMATGEAVDAALREVSRGAIEGWFGLDGISVRRGLSARMRDVLGNAWTPEDALLDWTLSHAGDDLTPNPRYQDRASLRVWDLDGVSYGWRPDAVLTPAAPTRFLFKNYGSPGWFRITGGDAGFTVQVEAYEVGARWRLLRIR